ncbi:MAG: amidohydrolase [Deltaproteobacteria bacterium]|nr:amidohydrolase [Deltaproteobacteria bacterium]
MTVSQELFTLVRDWRRHLHRHPELSGQETESAAFLSRVLDEHGISQQQEIGGHGIVATISPAAGERDAAPIAFRADFDALPLSDRKNCAYASANPGIMHACGHDGHAAVLLGLAVVLQKNRDRLALPVKLIFQPAEENGQGAAAMLEDGIFEPLPAAVFGFHFFPELETGRIALHHGAFMAATEYLEIKLRGRSAHACVPEKAIDAIQVAAHLIPALNQLVCKNLDPVDPALISIGTINGGTVSNIIADEVTLTGTIRTLSTEQHQRLHENLERLLHDLPRAFGAEAEITIGEVAPALVNDPRLVALTAGLLRNDFPEISLSENDPPHLGGEDFARLARLTPGCYLFFGSGNREAGIIHPLHSSLFDLDEKALELALRVLSEIAFRGPEVIRVLH